MKIKRSNLKILDINLITSFINFNKGSDEEIKFFFDTNNIDLDFEILDHKTTKNQFKIILILEINGDLESKKPGYSIYTILEGVFYVEDNSNKEDIETIKLRSALPMLISNLRSVIYDLTSKFPIGGFVLPSLEINHLIESKNNKSTKSKKRK